MSSYRYRVTLEGIKGFFRVYVVNGNNTLYTFHKQLRSDLEFPQDQQILFKAFDAEGNVAGRFALMPLPGNKAVDEVSIAETIKAGIVRFVYFYDVISKKSVNISFEGEDASEVQLPNMIESKGPLPIEFENGYVAFEDLPDDRRHLPGEKKASNPLAAILNMDDDEDLDDDDLDEEDEEDEDDDREEEEVIYDENEE